MAVVVILGGFGYRLYVGNELRAVVADAVFLGVIAAISFLAANRFAISAKTR